jgi:isoprenylcysteine carboxyl methyltransferase (ICMT) family protein YpbQ
MLGYYTSYVALLSGGDGISQYIQKQPYMHGDFQGQKLLAVLLAIYAFFSAIDVLFASIGYIFTFKILDADVRSTEPTLFGWVVCILCYEPFINIITIPLLFGPLFNNTPWYGWFAGHYLIFTVWGATAIVAMCCESLATLSFGIRFSNLTYRGLIANGLFRFTKHPQYVSKGVRFFFFYMPFLSMSGFTGMLISCGSFLGLCIMYYLRARTEENHLSAYPEYVEYAKIMNEKSIFCFMARIFPFLRYDVAKAKAGKLF